ncbi:alpha-amylase family glycosyl hydrolase [Dawidia cretensis]|uniref:alpha-amylase family glycosyl hydrolase n=1 Tax=Dawidia cretensis TaxID=2782350 RepID=UPI0020B3D1EB|nr:alpha-amylase family glycosyl hydrolase [Dawidia cretensis]
MITLSWLIATPLVAASIVLNKRDAEVWLPQQALTGSLIDLDVPTVRIVQADTSFSVSVVNRRFSFNVSLSPGANSIHAEAMVNGEVMSSGAVTLTLMYTPVPLVKLRAKAQGDNILLSVDVVENPQGRALRYYWCAHAQNPAVVKLSNSSAATPSARIPATRGRYTFSLAVIAGGDSTWYQTYVVRDAQGVHAFAPDTDVPAWMQYAVVYEVTPHRFVAHGTFRDITAKLPELKTLGINTLWLQPIFQTHQIGQGYDVTNYLALRSDLGSEQDFRTLVHTAKQQGIRVMLDIVPNHTSIHHPYAADYAAWGDRSHYARFYQHTFDGAPYASFYHKDEQGFVYYFWKDLVNLDYSNEEVQRWMIEVCKYWLRAYDVDGYRFDAVWGVISRQPGFAQRLRTELKSIKPDFLLLAEDKAADANVYAAGFDAAYDWTADTTWVSQWSWQYEYHDRESRTVFNHPSTEKRVTLLRDALFNNGDPTAARLRFLENNDLPRFIRGHNLAQTRMAAALLFALPGMPMLYNGQEMGYPKHPYSGGDLFRREQTIRSLDTTGLYDHYRQLIALRAAHPALTGNNLVLQHQAPQQGVLVLHRWAGQEHIIVLLNLGDTATTVPVDAILPPGTKKRLTAIDLLTGERLKLQTGRQTTVRANAHSGRWILLK